MTYSTNINSPEIIKELKSKRKRNFIIGIVIALIIMGFVICISVFSDELEVSQAIMVGSIIFVIIMIINIKSLVKSFRKPWDGEVIKQNTKERTENYYDEEGNYESSSTYDVYITKIKKDKGGKYKIERKNDPKYYRYFKVGDKVRYYPQFNEFEKFDKSKDKIIYCMICHYENKIENDRCCKCNNLLFK